MVKNVVEWSWRMVQRAASRPVILAAAVVIQVLLIGGLVVWGTGLGASATGSLPAAPDAGISVWVSDARWHVAPSLDVGRGEWTVGLSSPQNSSFGSADPTATAVVVLWDAARLDNPRISGLVLKPLSSAMPGSYALVQVPESQAHGWPGPGHGPAVPAQVFVVTAGEYYAPGYRSRSILPVTGRVSGDLYAQTSSGWAAYVPSIGVAGISLAGDCRTGVSSLPAAIASMVPDRPSAWYGVTCPTPSPDVTLLLGENENLTSSTFPPATQTISGDPVWTTQSSGAHPVVAGYLSGFWVDIGDPAIAAAAQRDLLFSGVLYGIAGGLIASWLVAGVIAAVSKKRRADRKGEPQADPLGRESGQTASAGPASAQAGQMPHPVGTEHRTPAGDSPVSTAPSPGNRDGDKPSAC